MSRGLGRVEIAIASAFIRNPTRAFTVSDLIAEAFPRTKTIQKKHKVSVTRSADRVAQGMGWKGVRTTTTPPKVVYANILSKTSFTECLVLADLPEASDEAIAGHLDAVRSSRERAIDGQKDFCERF